MFLEVLHLLLGVGNDGITAGLPAGRAHLAVLVSVLEGLDQPQGLIDRPSDGQVVHGDLSEDAFVVDDEEAAKGVAVVLEEDPVVLGDGVGEVRQEGNVEPAESALAAGGVHPSQVGEMRIHRASNNLTKESILI